MMASSQISAVLCSLCLSASFHRSDGISQFLDRLLGVVINFIKWQGR